MLRTINGFNKTAEAKSVKAAIEFRVKGANLFEEWAVEAAVKSEIPVVGRKHLRA